MTKSESKKIKSKTPQKLVIGVTGSIAAYKTCELIRILQKKGFDVWCMMTENAARFITPLTMETLTGHPVISAMFAAERPQEVEHIKVAEDADMFVIAPATANVIGKISSGICDDILTTVICATKKPVIIAPAMNEGMYTNPIVQEKIAYLKEKGYLFIEPDEGYLACGSIGKGRLASIDIIAKTIEKIAKKL
jgi:phosphopantothenoylcysteine decarboxylase / phosphopantothenate---cysteine ligase